MTVALQGAAELMKALNRLGDPKAAKRASRAAISKGLRVSAKAIKAAIPPKFKEGKKGIGSRFAKPKTRDAVEARVGVGVGISKKRLAGFKRKDRGKRPGVGVGPENLHWFILGTGERQTGSRTRKRRGGQIVRKPTGGAVRRTGSMKAQIPNIIRDGFKASEAAATAAIIEGIRAGIEREAKKAKG